MEIVREHITQFERGQNPKIAMGIGIIQQIEKWFADYNIKDYKILNDYTIDTYSEVILNSKGLFELPEYIKFNHAHLDFHINWNNLKNLIGCPKIVTGHFYCNGNPLTSLEGIPKQVSGAISIAKACGFTEDEIKNVCDVEYVYLTNNERESWDELKQVRERYK